MGKLGRGTAIPHHKTPSADPKKIAARAASIEAYRAEEEARQTAVAAAYASERVQVVKAQADKVRANLMAWLANRASQPEHRHPWLEAQCIQAGLLP